MYKFCMVNRLYEIYSSYNYLIEVTCIVKSKICE